MPRQEISRLTAIVLLAGLHAVPAYGKKLYWTDTGGDSVLRADVCGASRNELTDSSGPLAIALDLTRGKVYWTSDGVTKVSRSNLDGTSTEEVVTAGLDAPKGMALDTAGQKMYVTDTGATSGNPKILRFNLDGSGLEELVTTGLGEPVGIALDLAAGKMYWADGGTAKIQRANLDGSAEEDLVASGLGTPTGIALDLEQGKIYWTDPSLNKIQRSNLDGSMVEDVAIHETTPQGIALDLELGKMYWASSAGRELRRANLDGSDVKVLIGTRSSSPFGVAIDPRLLGGDCDWFLATLTELEPVALGTLRDINGDDVAEELEFDDVAFVSSAGNSRRRGVHEFNIGGFAGSQISSAVFTGEMHPNVVNDNGERGFRVVGYVGNGVAEIPDYNAAGTELGTFSYLPPYAGTEISIDATAYVQSLVDGATPFVGFRIEPTTDPNAVNVITDAALTIKARMAPEPPSIVVTSPSGGETFTAGDPFKVTWIATGLAQKGVVNVLLRDRPDGPGAIVGLGIVAGVEFTVGRGQATFTLPTWLGDGGDYYAEVWAWGADVNPGPTTGRSDGPFSITGSGGVSRIELTVPTTAGTVTRWPAGTTQRIRWRAAGVDGTVSLGFYEDLLGIATPTSQLASVGSVDWSIPDNIGNGDRYQILVFGLGVGILHSGVTRPFDLSDTFEIYDSQSRPTLTLTTPNGGEVFEGGSSQQICWTTSEASGSVLLRRSQGQAFADFNDSRIVSVRLPQACKSWTPCRYLASDDFRILASLNLGAGVAVSDRSDTGFTIVPSELPPTVRLTFPTGGMVLTGGASHSITWDTADAALSGDVNISLITTASAGTTETTLAFREPAATCGSTGNYCGTFDTVLCPSLEPDAEYRIRLCGKRYLCPGLCEVSEPFFLTGLEDLPDLEVTSPAPDDLWTIGTGRSPGTPSAQQGTPLTSC